MPKAINAFQQQFYDEAVGDQEKELRAIADVYLSTSMSSETLQSAMLDSLKKYYIRLALVAKNGRPFIERDRQDIGRFLGLQKTYLDGFVQDMAEFRQSVPQKAIASASQALARSGSYANGQGVFTRFLIPAALADVLPALPGLDCLGGMRCGCWLEWSASEEQVEVYWHVNPAKEHCLFCAEFDVEWSPLVIPIEELDSDLLDEEYDFFYD